MIEILRIAMISFSLTHIIRQLQYVLIHDNNIKLVINEMHSISAVVLKDSNGMLDER